MVHADLDAVFAALAHPARRLMLDVLRAQPGLTVAALSRHFDMSGVGVLKHVRVLQTAGLVVGERVGRALHLYFNIVPIQRVYDRWSDEYAEFWATRMVDLKDRLESRAEAKEARRA